MIDIKNMTQEILASKTHEDFESAISKMIYALRKDNQIQIADKILKASVYIQNRFSRPENEKGLERAKQRVLNIIDNYRQIDFPPIISILRNFLLFKETLLNRCPNQKSTLQLSEIELNNEYDVQHLLFSMLKPMFPTVQIEVPMQTPVGGVRADLYLANIDMVIEVKFTRPSKRERELTDEIEADILHYPSKNIVFLIYDKAHIIKNKEAYEEAFHRTFDNKEVVLILLQPKIL